MSSPATILTLGYGSFGSPSDVLLLGYGISAAVELPPRRTYIPRYPPGRGELVGKHAGEVEVGTPRAAMLIRFVPAPVTYRCVALARVGACRAAALAARGRATVATAVVGVPTLIRQHTTSALARLSTPISDVLVSKARHAQAQEPRPVLTRAKRRRLREEAALLGLDEATLLGM